jgi:hypothetical protein
VLVAEISAKYPTIGTRIPTRFASVAVADIPTVVANNLPVGTVRQLSPQVIDWVPRNKDALLDFWYHGDTWTQPEVNDFIQKLQRV